MACGSCGKTIKKGIIGLTKVALGIDTDSPDNIKRKRDICRVCEFATLNKERLNRPTKGLTTLSRCIKCNCFIAAKSKLKSESCPDGRW